MKGGLAGRRWITPLGEEFLDARRDGYGRVTALTVAHQRVDADKRPTTTHTERKR